MKNAAGPCDPAALDDAAFYCDQAVRSIPVMIRLEGALLRDANVGGLLVGHLGQLGAASRNGIDPIAIDDDHAMMFDQYSNLWPSDGDERMPVAQPHIAQSEVNYLIPAVKIFLEWLIGLF